MSAPRRRTCILPLHPLCSIPFPCIGVSRATGGPAPEENSSPAALTGSGINIPRIISNERLEGKLTANIFANHTLQWSDDQLIELANQNGGHDNVSCVVAHLV